MQRLGLIGKCLFVFPPIDYEELGKRLLVLSAALGLQPQDLPSVDAVGRRLIGLHFADNGAPVLIGVDGRDDLAYQTMFEKVGPMLAVRNLSAATPLAVVPSEPRPVVARYMEPFESRRGEPEQPTMSSGLMYVLLMLRSAKSMV